LLGRPEPVYPEPAAAAPELVKSASSNKASIEVGVKQQSDKPWA